jgi:5-oxoprolinase (ATP-hydrolysing)
VRTNSKGGPLAVTDANLLLGRLLVDYFPKIFGKSEKEPLDAEASRKLFEGVVKEVNEAYASGEAVGEGVGEGGKGKMLSLDEVVYG